MKTEINPNNHDRKGTYLNNGIPKFRDIYMIYILLVTARGSAAICTNIWVPHLLSMRLQVENSYNTHRMEMWIHDFPYLGNILDFYDSIL